MASGKPGFNFEAFVVEQLKGINEKIDGLNTVFLPREEALLMKRDRDEKLDNLNTVTAMHTVQINKLKATDDRQQGGIDAQRNWINILVGLSAAGMAFLIYLLTK